MRKFALRGLVLVVVIGLLGVGSFAIAGGGSKHFKGLDMTGYEENPDLSTVGTGSFKANLSDDGTKLEYELSYSGLEGTVTQSHVHFGKTAINGGISFFLCSNLPSPPPGTPACPVPAGTVEGEIDAADVLGPNAPPATRGSSRATSPRSSPRCALGTPTPTSTRPSGPVARSARRSTTTSGTTTRGSGR